MIVTKGLSFDDVLLTPQYSEIDSRKNVNISSLVFKGELIRTPILSANMPAITGAEMAIKMHWSGGLGVLHRFNTIEENKDEVRKIIDSPDGSEIRFGVSLGLNDGMQRAKELQLWCDYFFLDTAHGDSKKVQDFVIEFVDAFPLSKKLAVGNVATYRAAYELAALGADAIKVGIGPGAACTTREVTGHGVPQLTAIRNVVQIKDDFPNVKVIADGGIKNSGDIVKALALGADTVMIGRLFAGCNETPNPDVYYGSASHHVNNHNAPEGAYGRVERQGSVEGVMKKLKWGIKSGLSYSGAATIEEFHQIDHKWIEISHGSHIENGVRL